MQTRAGKWAAEAQEEYGEVSGTKSNDIRIEAGGGEGSATRGHDGKRRRLDWGRLRVQTRAGKRATVGAQGGMSTAGGPQVDFVDASEATIVCDAVGGTDAHPC